MLSPRGSSFRTNVLKSRSWSNSGSILTMVSASRTGVGNWEPISGVWHKRTYHPVSNVGCVTGGIGRVVAVGLLWAGRAKAVKSLSVASVSINAPLPLRQPGEPRFIEFFSHELRFAQRASSFEVGRIVDLLERREAVVA
eukprot:6214480-Pleurochrysis_carterae.AAC.3